MGSPNPPKPRGPLLTRPRLGLNPTSPQIEAGMRSDPPPSLPWASGTRPAATAAAAPPLDPPAVAPGDHGLRAAGATSVSEYSDRPNSLAVVLPRLISPASRRRTTTSASTVGTKSANAALPNVVRTPAVRVRSLTATGTPARGRRGFAVDRELLLTWAAAARAASAVTVTNAPY